MRLKSQKTDEASGVIYGIKVVYKEVEKYIC